MAGKYTYPGVYIEEVPSGTRTIMGVSTSITAFIGRANKGLLNVPMRITSFEEFERELGPPHQQNMLAQSVRLFFENGGVEAYVVRIARNAEKPKKDKNGVYEITNENEIDQGPPNDFDFIGTEEKKTGIYALNEIDLFNLLIIPNDESLSEDSYHEIYSHASRFCKNNNAFLLIDPPKSWVDSQENAIKGIEAMREGLEKDYAAVFYPMIEINDKGKTITIGPSGAIAGLIARTDSNRGVWKAPAGTEAEIRGIIGLNVKLTNDEIGKLNPLAINCLRFFETNIVSWGARTLEGADQLGSEWKYIPIRRLALFLEESLDRGTQWVVFEPNDEPLWAQIRLNIGNFMHNLFRQGAFQGSSPKEAYFVKCDSETTTQEDITKGIVNILVGFAPLKPAEFVVIKISQIAGKLGE